MGHSTVEDWLAAGNKIQRGPDRYAAGSEHGTKAPDLTPVKTEQSKEGVRQRLRGLAQYQARRRSMQRGL